MNRRVRNCLKSRCKEFGKPTSFHLCWLLSVLLGGGMISQHEIIEASEASQYTGVVSIEFLASSTLHDFKGQVKSETFSIMLGPKTWSAEAAVRSESMDTANKRRDRRMHEMFEGKKHPFIRGRVANAKRNLGDGDAVLLLLQIRNAEVEVPMTISGWKEAGEQLTFNGIGHVSLKALGLVPPSVLFGAVRVGDLVELRMSVKTRIVTKR